MKYLIECAVSNAADLFMQKSHDQLHSQSSRDSSSKSISVNPKHRSMKQKQNIFIASH